jgi:hypothetical protein
MKILTLSPNWRISFDNQQWIVQRRQTSKGKNKWASVSFVGSTKQVLLYVLKRDRVVINKAGQKTLDALPATFIEWRDA